jgi:hypothetical protein
MKLSKGMSTTAACLLTLSLGTAAAGTAAVYDGGLIRVHVVEKKKEGNNIHVFVPGIAVPIALKLAPDRELAKAGAKIRGHLPIIQAALEGLEECPDTVFVEVISDREYVKVEKRGGLILVNVDSEDETVSVAVPLQAVRYAVNELKNSAERAETARNSD